MPAATLKRPNAKTASKPQSAVARPTLDLSFPYVAGQPFVMAACGSTAPPLLSPSKFSVDDQSADCSAFRTRLLKDCLRVGSWKVGFNPDGSPRLWTVTEETLQKIRDTFADQQAAGIIHNLVWGHESADDLNTGTDYNVDARNIIAPIDDLIVKDGTLWFTVYVSPELQSRLTNPGMQVSVPDQAALH